MSQITSPKPLLDGTVHNNFPLFSSKHDDENWVGDDDFFSTLKEPFCAPVLDSVNEASL